ncbi:MAG: tRNA threonylcarbamoyladenosine dehydratase [Clostridia bacterium]|nr:tRNA threonylcarbamoyladenosine dehydratase [Clostridia bacterium]
MKGQFDRTIGLIGENALKQLQKSKVAVVGLGGVGSYSVEALARSGVGSLVIADCDVISLSNINRQLPALNSTVDKEKVQIVKDRILDINPDLEVYIISEKISDNTPKELFVGCDYIIDAIDDVNAKVFLIKTAKELNIPIISSMGTGNKLNISSLMVTDIFNTSICPLCKVMRKRLRDENIESLDVVYSDEMPRECTFDEEGKRVPSSMMFVPAAAGLLLAETVVKRLIK